MPAAATLPTNPLEKTKDSITKRQTAAVKSQYRCDSSVTVSEVRLSEVSLSELASIQLVFLLNSVRAIIHTHTHVHML